MRGDSRVIFTTYQSGDRLVRAARLAKMKFDLVIFDEAHRTAGPRYGQFATLLRDGALNARYRLFMTAGDRTTPAAMRPPHAPAQREGEDAEAERSIGSRMVERVSDVPAGVSALVDDIKHKVAELIDIADGLKQNYPRLSELAKTHFEIAEHLAVKAATS